MGADFGLRPGRVPVAGKATQRAALTVSIMLTQQVHKVDPVKKLAEAKDEATREVLQKLIAAEEAKPPPTPKCPVGVSLAKRCRTCRPGWFGLSLGEALPAQPDAKDCSDAATICRTARVLPGLWLGPDGGALRCLGADSPDARDNPSRNGPFTSVLTAFSRRNLAMLSTLQKCE